MSPSHKRMVAICKDSEEVAERLREYLQQKYDEFAKRNDGNGGKKFLLGLSGGSLPKFFSAAAATMATSSSSSSSPVDWHRVRFFFCDERVVPFTSDDSTYKVYREVLVEKVEGIGEDSFVTIDPTLSAEEAARDYARKLATRSGQPGGAPPRLDVLLLGMGPDGHTCSLFPGHPVLHERELLVAPVTDSPKPPPLRVTLTLPVLNAAAAAVFICTGGGKKEVVRAVLEEEGCGLPAAMVRPHDGELIWLLDAPAAAALNKA